MYNIFFKDELPYLLTILIGLAAYQLNNIISIQTDTPILAYQFKTISTKIVGGNIQNELECTLVNYNRKKAIKDVNINISYKSKLPSPKKVESPNIIAVAPSAILPDTMTNAAFGLINEYKIPIIQPYSEYILTLETTTNASIKEYPKLYLYSKESIRLVEHNFQVFLIKNQVCINIILLAIWLGFTIFYLIFLSKSKIQEDETTS